MTIQTNVNSLSPAIYQRLTQVINAVLGDVFPACAIAVIHEGSLVLDIGTGVIDPETGQGTVPIPILPKDQTDIFGSSSATFGVICGQAPFKAQPWPPKEAPRLR